jgi:ribosomal protein S18 acetylase RimI-like enzyme
VLAAFDAQVRRSTCSDGSGALIHAERDVVRWVSVDGRGWSGISWSRLGEAAADKVIAAQVAYFRARGERFEWKLYDYDQPPDLAQRLLAAGFVPEGDEALMMAETAQVAQVVGEAALPSGVRLLPVTDEAGVGMLIDVHERVFGADHSQLRRSLLTQLREAPGLTAMVVAVAGTEPVSSARVEFLPGRQFASLWGGGTVAGWRGRGIYRALVAHRAAIAAARGYRYLQVDASPESEPILRRLGFASLARVTPYIRDPMVLG